MTSYINLTACCDPAEGDQPANNCLVIKDYKKGIVMANWDDIMNNRLMMGRSRQLCYAVNAERRRREEEEGRPGAIPLIGRGIRPVIPRFQQEGLREENFYWS